MYHDGIDPIVKRHYPNGVHDHRTPPRPHDYVNPWQREWLSRKQDLVRAPVTDDWDLKLDLGTFTVEGFGVNAGPLGALEISVDGKGRLTCALRSDREDRP